jgi:predicted RNase H-like nuclease (RuvC/YqgF family)
VHLTLIEPSNKSQSPQAPACSRAYADSPQKLSARRSQLLKRIAELNAEKSGLEAEVASAKHGLQTTGMLQRELRVELERTVRQSHECDCMVLELTRAERGVAGLASATSAGAQEQLTVTI